MSADPDSKLGTYVESTYLAVPGKCMWDCPAVHRKPLLAKSIEAGLARVPGISSSRANYWTGRIRVEHDTELDPRLLVRLVDEVVRVCVASHADDYPMEPEEEGPTASAIRLGREVAEQLVIEARHRFEDTSGGSPEGRPGLAQVLRGRLLRRTWPGSRGSVESPPMTSSAIPRDGEDGKPLGALWDLPSLEPLVIGLSRWVVDNYGGERVAELLETSEERPLSGLLGALLGGQPRGGAPERRNGGLMGGVMDRLGSLWAASREPLQGESVRDFDVDSDREPHRARK